MIGHRQRVALLIQLDGKFPSVALMRLSTHYKALGWRVVFMSLPGENAFERTWWEEPDPDAVFASLIFTWSRPLALKVLKRFPFAQVGGTGWDLGKEPHDRATLEKLGVGLAQDYSLYPGFTASIGYTMRGCRMTEKICPFCDVWRSEGKPRAEQDIASLWRGGTWPRHLLLLDNDFGGGPQWRDLARVIREGGFRVCFSQGINARLVTEEVAETVCSLDYRDDSFEERRFYCAWDNRRDEQALFLGLRRLVKHGMKPDEILVYMLVGYDHETKGPRPLCEDDFYRHERLRDFGCRPFPMPFRGVSGKPDMEIMGFARWAIRRNDTTVSWERWKAARFQVRNLPRKTPQRDLFVGGSP